MQIQLGSRETDAPPHPRLARRLPPAALPRRFREKRLNDPFQLVTLALWTMNLRRLVLFDRQRFSELMPAFPTYVFIYWHCFFRSCLSIFSGNPATTAAPP